MFKTYYYYKIYKDDFCYIGSTTNLKKRQNGHKNRCTNENSKCYNLKLYKTIRENGGWECFTFELIKQFDNLTKQEARVIEQVYINEFGNMNSLNSYITQQQLIELKYKCSKQYRLNNQEELKQSKHQYYLNNQEKLKEQQNQYYLNNQDKLKEYQNQYRLNNRDKILEHSKKNITCECGCEIRIYELPRHRKSKIHQDYLRITEV
jgi:hypothetical protein